MIGEIAARLSGGYMSGWTYPYSSGVLSTKGAIEIALGKKPLALEPEWNWSCAERAFISIPGRVFSVCGAEKARIMPFVKDVFMRIESGSTVKFPENNVTKCGNVISAAPQREDAVNSAENAARSILIRLEAPNDTTDAFLAVPPSGERAGFPPDAFTLDAGLLSLLSSLSSGGPGGEGLIPFPEFTCSGLRDFMGRGVEESLEAVRALTGMKLLIGNNENGLGRAFWRALVRGGYQGAVYYLDSLYNG
jgi:hypothetical protein